MVAGGRRINERIAGIHAMLAIARTTCRLKSTGIYPDRLEVADPFTGNPMVYRREGCGYVLYSVGENLEDDGGGEGDIGISVTR